MAALAGNLAFTPRTRIAYVARWEIITTKKLSWVEINWTEISSSIKVLVLGQSWQESDLYHHPDFCIDQQYCCKICPSIKKKKCTRPLPPKKKNVIISRFIQTWNVGTGFWRKCVQICKNLHSQMLLSRVFQPYSTFIRYAKIFIKYASIFWILSTNL